MNMEERREGLRSFEFDIDKCNEVVLAMNDLITQNHCNSMEATYVLSQLQFTHTFKLMGKQQ